VRYLAGDVLQVVGPRAADRDGIIQGEAPGLEVALTAFLPPQRGSRHNQPFFIIRSGRAASPCNSANLLQLREHRAISTAVGGLPLGRVMLIY
jgi:hypothetical protein